MPPTHTLGPQTKPTHQSRFPCNQSATLGFRKFSTRNNDLSHFDENGASVTLRFTLKNVGRAPALYVWPHIRSILQGVDSHIAVRGELCQTLARFPQPRHGFTIVPDQSHSIDLPIVIGRDQIVKSVEYWKVPLLLPIIVGIVDYHGPRQLRVTTLHGLVFGTFSDETPAIENFIGPDVLARFERVLGGRKIEIIGRFVEVLPNNWKLYAENARDSYHASLLHLFFATFKLNRLSQGGGLVVSPNGGCSVSETLAPTETDDKSYAGMRSVDEDYNLKDMRLMDVVDEHPDRIRHQIVTVFPNLVLQKTQNAMAIRFFTPKAVDRTHLEWIYFGYADDTPEMRKRRLRHLNLGGPAGFVSMEDGCVGGFVERGIATAEAESAIVRMGGGGVESQATRATEAAVRGFWSLWRRMTGL